MSRRLDIEAALNPEQRAAVAHGDGPQLVLAGAGSGKTRVITWRLAWLVRECGVDPGDLAAITFTNKAAQEMAGRVEELLEVYPLPTFVGTFHRFALRLLRRWGDRVGLARGFSICDQKDQIRLVKKAMQTEELDERALAPQAVLSAISSAKNRLLTPEEYERDADDFFRRRVARVYRHYRDLLREAEGVDFDDMLMLAVQLLREDTGLRERVRSRVRYLMADEFQDTNHAQLQLILELVGPDGNLTAVGDEDQAIYRWRGAEIDNILEFEKTFPGATVRRLERNYRSTANILDAAGEMVAHNERRRGKRLWTEGGDGRRITLYRARDEHDEARWIVDALVQDRDRTPLGDCAVLVRTHAQTRVLEEELLKRDLPYELVGGVRFYERAEIKDVLSYLRLLRNPRDLLALDRILNQPPRGIGDVTRSWLEERARQHGGRLWDVLVADDVDELKPRAARAVRSFRDLIVRLSEEAEQLPLPALVEHVLEETAYLSLFDRSDPDGQARLENLQELLSAAQDFTESEAYRGAEDVLEAFLDRVALQGDIDDAQLERGVGLMTLHSAKGLEFPTVVVAGLEDGSLPHFNSQGSREDLEEERRLLYVGMTRAETRLLLTTAVRRRVAGVYQDREPSPFLGEVPDRLIDEESSPSLFDVPGRRSFGRGRSASPSRWRGGGQAPADQDAVLSFFGRAPKPEESASDAAPETATVAARPPRPDRPLPPPHSSRPSTSRPSRPAGPRRGSPPSGDFRRGTNVRHQSLGQGTVLAVEGSGDDLRLTVYFPSHGRRKLVARYARLEIV